MKYPGKFYSRLNKYRNDYSSSYDLCEMFDTSETGVEQIMNIMENVNDYVFDSFSWQVMQIEWQEVSNFSGEHSDRSAIWNYFFRDIEENFKENTSLYRLLLKCFCAYCLIDQKVSNGTGIQIDELNQNIIENKKSSRNYYYRGQSDRKWGLVPSMFRNNIFIDNISDGDYFEIKRMFDIYKNAELIKRANETIFEDNKVNQSNIGYGFISFMQHCVAFSPLIDVTNKIGVASMFALGNRGDFNSYRKNESIVFEFYLEEKASEIDVDTLLRSDEFSIRVLKGKIKPGTMANLSDVNGVTKVVDFTTISSIIKELKPKYKLVTTPTNDRMRYQHGSFILFYDYLLVNNRIMFQLNRDINVRQYIIPVSKKDLLFDYLHRNYEQYSMNHMLNPYIYFGE